MPQTRNRLKPVQTGRFHLGWVFSPWRRGAFGTWASAPSLPAYWPAPATAAPSAYLLLASPPVTPTSSLHTSPPLRPPPLSSSDLPAEWGKGVGRVEKEREGGGGGWGGGTRAEPSRGESEKKPQGGLVWTAVHQTYPALDFPFPLPPLPLLVLIPQTLPFRPAHWLGAFGDGEGGEPIRSWWWREFERGARQSSFGFPGFAAAHPRRLPPTCGAWARRDEDPPLEWGLRHEKGVHTQLFF